MITAWGLSRGGPKHRMVWMYGPAGCGKTILSSAAIEDIKTYCHDGQANAAQAIFYFSFSDNRKQGLLDLLYSLVEQLAWKEPAFSMDGLQTLK